MSIERREPRQSLEVDVDVREPGMAGHRLHLKDITSLGCRISLLDRVKLDSRLFVKFPSLESIPCYVCWCKDFEAGLEFEKPLHPAVLEHLIAKLKSD